VIERLAIAMGLLLVAACGDDAAVTPDAGPSTDAGGAVDVLTPGPLVVAVAGPTIAYVGEEACYRAEHAEDATAVHTWIWGDDTRDELTGTRDACHSWPFPGEVLVSVIVHARGMRADATQPVSIVFRPSTPRPTHSSPIAYDADRDRVWAVSPDSDTVAVIDAATLELVAEIPVGDRPRTVAVAGDVALVACQDDATLHRIDRDTLAPLAPIALRAGAEPYGVVAAPDAARAVVTLSATDRIAIVDPITAAITAELDVGPDPRGLAVNADGTLIVTRWRSDAEGARVTTVDLRAPDAPEPLGVTVWPPSVDVDSDTDNDGVLGFLDQIVFSPDGGRALLPALKANVVAGRYRVGRDLTSQTTARGVLGEVMITARDAPVRESFRHSFDDLDFASAVAFSPEGERAYVAFQGAEAILAIDPFTFAITGSIDDVGHAPQGLAVSPDGTRLFVHAFLSREVRVYDVTDLSRDPEPLAVIHTVATEPLTPDVLAGKILFYRSRDPRMSRTSYLSCASCHLDGEGDGLVWDFTQRGEGLRNTIPLRGRAGLGHGLLHWSANFDEVQDFEHDIRAGQGGTGFLPDALFHSGTVDQTLGDPKAGLSPELDALAAYVTSLASFGTSPHRRDGDPAWEAAFARGRAIFESAEAECATCHVAPAYTDSGFDAAGAPVLHDVGTLAASSGARLGATLTGLDTPTLRGLWRSAPYLHDGSAPTLRDVLVTRNPAAAHGNTSHLDAAALEDLVAFLLALDDRAP
jgi:YVTN family beta-propeller protein